MTELLSRPRPAPGPPDQRRSPRRSPGPDGQPAWFPLLPTAVVAVVVAAVVGLVLCVGLSVLGWIAAPGADVVAASRVGTWVWLLANGSLLHVRAAGPGTVDSPATAVAGFAGPVAVAPLGLSLLLVAALARTSAAAIRAAVPVVIPGAARRETRPLITMSAAMVIAYVGLAVAVGRWLADGSPTVRVDLGRTAAGAAIVAVVGVGLGVVAGTGGWRRLLRDAPRPVAALVRGAAAGSVMLALASLVLFAVTVVGHLPRIVALSRAVGGGGIGQTLLTLGQVALLPQGLADALSWMTGAGFTVGSGTLVAPSGVVLGPLPAVPALGALPDPGVQPLWSTLLLLVPALAGVLAGFLAARRVRRPLVGAAAIALASGLVVGLLGSALLAAARAHVGDGRLAAVGPVFAPAAVLLLAACSVGGLLGVVPVAVRSVLPTRRPVPAPVEPPHPAPAGDRPPFGWVLPHPVPPPPVDPPVSVHPPFSVDPPVAAPPVGSAAVDPLLHGVLQLLGADLRLLLGARGVLDAGDRAGDVGPEADQRHHDRQDDDESDASKDGADRGRSGAEPSPSGSADAADPGAEGDAGRDHSKHESHEGGPGVDRGEPESEDGQAGPDDAGPQGAVTQAGG